MAANTKAKAGSCKFRTIYVGDGKIGSGCAHPEIHKKLLAPLPNIGAKRILRVTSPLVCSDCPYREPSKDEVPIVSI